MHIIALRRHIAISIVRHRLQSKQAKARGNAQALGRMQVEEIVRRPIEQKNLDARTGLTMRTTV